MRQHPWGCAVIISGLLCVVIFGLGISLGLLPLYLTNELGFTPTVVGAVIALESISTLLSRLPAGRFSDRRGAKCGMLWGLALSALAGAMCLLAIQGAAQWGALGTLGIILLSRIVMGIGESLVFTCSGTWPIGLIGRESAGKVMSMVGIGMFIGLAAGNGVGGLAHQGYLSLTSGAWVMTLPPLFGWGIALCLPSAPIVGTNASLSLVRVVARVWPSGAGFALSNMGYAAIMSFLMLMFWSKGWQSTATIALVMYSVGYVLSRLSVGFYTSRLGRRATVLMMVIEALGLAMIACAGISGASIGPLLAIVGSFLTGYGLSMVYPLLGVTAIGSLPAAHMGVALSAYEACFDIGILLVGCISGVLSAWGYAAIFGLAATCALLACGCAQRAWHQHDARALSAV
ncbi:MFS transporter [Zymobacter sp. IVIA_12111.31 C1]|uniref:MFS transporter n=1 Tax=Zymobacter sp. IVIA_12111.31 C1 TaxID=3394854 RepID=UPI0039C03434